MRFGCIVTACARLIVDAVLALEESVTDFWHAVHAILYTRSVFCSATNPRASISLRIAENKLITFALR
jgi:hypothetical protein